MERASGNYAFVRRVIEMKRTNVLIIRSPRALPAFNCKCETSSLCNLVVIFSLVQEELEAV